MLQICKSCERPVREGEHVRAVIFTVYHELKSRISYALDKPYHCEGIEHINCQYPAEEYGAPEGE